MVYKLKLPYLIKQLHPIFNIVKLSVTLEDLILDRKLEEYLLFILINREEEWKVEEILNSHQHWRWFQYLIKQNMVMNTTPGSPSPKFLYPILQWTSIADTQELPNISTGLSLMCFFHSEPIALRYSNLGGRVNVRGLH